MLNDDLGCLGLNRRSLAFTVPDMGLHNSGVLLVCNLTIFNLITRNTQSFLHDNTLIVCSHPHTCKNVQITWQNK